jgi:hypothetical protein
MCAAPSSARGLFALASVAAIASLLATDAPAAGMWQRVSAQEPGVFAQRLRDIGMPPAELGLLVAHHVDEQFAAREAELVPPAASVEAERAWWTPERRAARLDLHREKIELVRKILGRSPEPRPESDWVREQFPRLARDRQDQVRAITEDYDELLASLSTAGQGHVTLDDLGMEIFIEENRSQELAAYLTADQVIDYQLHHSRVGRKLRRHLECFEPTQAELRTCWQVLHEFGYADDYLQTGFKVEQDIPDGRTIPRTRVYQRDLPARLALLSQLADLWTPARFVHYHRATNEFYRSTFLLVRRLGRPQTATEKIFDSRIECSATEEEVQPYLGPADQMPVRNFGRFPALVGRHCELVRSLLGEKGYAEYYRRNASWIETLREGKPAVFKLDY